MPMIWETSVVGALGAMDAAFEAAYSAADNSRVALNPAVVTARAAAQAAHANAVDAVRAAQAAGGFLRAWKARLAVSRAGYAASVAEGNLRAAIRDANAVLEGG
jgi:hypothetical protein